jgi:arabinan endo-1,5-alpha-L-arabinosidase
MPTYHNPVYRGSCPDPFVLKHKGEYWGYCTGFSGGGRVFDVLHSPDLVHWRRVGGAMQALPGGHTCYWAPEVFYAGGLFTLYYSTGDGVSMHIRSAVSKDPAGPF